MDTNMAPSMAGGITIIDMSIEKIRENRVRRMAERQGLRLEKSRSRDPRAIGYGTYRLVNAENSLVLGDYMRRGYGMTLDEIEAYLTGDDEGGGSS